MDWISLLILFLAGIGSFTLSTVSGGGGAMTLVPVLNFWFGSVATAPILNLAMTIGRPARLILFWKDIRWGLSFYYIPSALIGVLLGGLVVLKVDAEWFQIIIGMFLVSTLFQYKFGKRKYSFTMRPSYFIPLGLGVGFLGTLTGGLGPVLNPFYLNAGMEKEELIATKTANSFFVGVAQIIVYSSAGILNKELTIEGVVLGIGVILGTVIGKRFLKKMSSDLFHQLFLLMMVISGVLLIWRAVSSLCL